MYYRISIEDKKWFIQEVLTIQELYHLLFFRDDDEQFQKEFIKLWNKYQEKNFQSNFVD